MEPVNDDNLSYDSQDNQEPNRFDQGYKFEFGPTKKEDDEPSLIQEAQNSAESKIPVVAASSLALLAEENAQMKDDLEKRLLVIAQYKTIVAEYEDKLDYELKKNTNLHDALFQTQTPDPKVESGGWFSFGQDKASGTQAQL
jgi:hypothetical protein